MRFERTTCCLRNSCSTTELRRHREKMMIPGVVRLAIGEWRRGRTNPHGDRRGLGPILASRQMMTKLIPTMSVLLWNRNLFAADLPAPRDAKEAERSARANSVDAVKRERRDR